MNGHGSSPIFLPLAPKICIFDALYSTAGTDRWASRGCLFLFSGCPGVIRVKVSIPQASPPLAIQSDGKERTVRY